MNKNEDVNKNVNKELNHLQKRILKAIDGNTKHPISINKAESIFLHITPIRKIIYCVLKKSPTTTLMRKQLKHKINTNNQAKIDDALKSRNKLFAVNNGEISGITWFDLLGIISTVQDYIREHHIVLQGSSHKQQRPTSKKGLIYKWYQITNLYYRLGRLNFCKLILVKICFVLILLYLTNYIFNLILSLLGTQLIILKIIFFIISLVILGWIAIKHVTVDFSQQDKKQEH